MERLEGLGGSTKLLFPGFKPGYKLQELWKLDVPFSYCTARRTLLEAVKASGIKIKSQNGPLGLHSFRVGALTAAAGSGRFSSIQLASLGR